MPERDNVVSPKKFADHYERRFGRLPGAAEFDQNIIAYDNSIAGLPRIQRFLFTGKIDELYDDILWKEDIGIIARLEEEKRIALFNDFGYLQANKEIVFGMYMYGKTQVGLEYGILARGPLIKRLNRTAEVVGIATDPESFDAVEFRLLRPESSIPPLPPIEFGRRRKEKQQVFSQKRRNTL